MTITKTTPEGRKFLCSKEYASAREWMNAFPQVYGGLPAKVALAFAERDWKAAK
jgi:hypothetical protein